MSFIAELRRRRVFRAGAAYLVVAWLLLQVVDVVGPILALPDWVARLVLLLLVIGLPIALVVAWVYELTPEGIRRDDDAQRSPAATAAASRKADLVIIGVLAVAVTLFALDKFLIGVVGVERQRSIAVLPFRNTSGQLENEPFAVGIHDDILTHISKISGIKVISRTSVERVDRNRSIREIGDILGVATVLEGGVQRSGDRIRINVQLIDARTDEHLWAESFDRELTTGDIFAIQSDIAAAITRTLRATLSPRDEKNLNRRPTPSLAAYEAYLRGRQLVVLRNVEDLRTAIEQFSDAIELDPDYSLAYSGLADAHMLLVTYGQTESGDALGRADRAITRALELDGQLSRAHASRGLYHAKRLETAEAEASYKRAIELDPNDATAYHWFGNLLVEQPGRSNEAVELLERARELDPLAPVISVTLGEALENLGRFDEAMSVYRKTVEVQPNFAGAYFVIGALERFAYGRLDEAARWHEREFEVDPDRDRSILAYTYMELGDEQRAGELIDHALATRPEHFWPNAAKSFLHWFRGEDELSLARARRLARLFPGNNVSAVAYVRLGHYEDAVRELMDNDSDLNCEDPGVDRNNIFHAINLSLALEKTGREACAALLLDRAWQVTRRMPRNGLRGYGFADVEILARQGKTDAAMTALRQAVDEGRRADWWWQCAHSPHLETLRGREDFEAVIDRIRADMSVQLERLRRLGQGDSLASPAT